LINKPQREMKPKKLKLQLNKETIEVMNEMQLDQVQGGTNWTQIGQLTEGIVTGITTNIMFEDGKDTSYWRCDPNAYAPMADKSQWVGGKGGATLDNTAVSQGGQYICIKPY
jgi:hypothetical protein